MIYEGLMPFSVELLMEVKVQFSGRRILTYQQRILTLGGRIFFLQGSERYLFSRLGQIMLYVNNQDDAVEFWTEKLGFTVIAEESSSQGREMD